MTKESLQKRVLLRIISCVAAIGGFLFGHDTGVISSAILYIKEEYLVTLFQEQLIISIVALGAIFGAISGGAVSDRLGRKKVVLASNLIFILAAIGLFLTQSVNGIIVWRLLVGVAIGLSSAVALLYIAELSPRHIRGALVSINQLFITIGILGSYLIGLLFVQSQSWRIMFILAGIPAAVQFLIMLFFPESPRYLIRIGEKAKAFNILKKLRGDEQDVTLEIAHIEKTAHKQRPQWSELFSKTLRPRLAVGIGVAIIQQITGINTIIYYAPTIFKFAGFSSNKAALIATTSVGVVNVLMTCVALYLIDKIGRKPLLLSGLGGMVLSLIALGIGLEQNVPKNLIGILVLISLFVYIASFAYSLGPISWLLNSEIYPLDIRGKAIGVATSANWISNFIITLTFLTLIHLLGKGAIFWLYAFIGVVGLFFIWRLVPETKGKSLEEIEEFWK